MFFNFIISLIGMRVVYKRSCKLSAKVKKFAIVLPNYSSIL